MAEQDRYQLQGSAPQIYEEYKVPVVFRPLAELTLQYVEVKEGARVIDVACAALFQRHQIHETVESLSRAFAYYYDMGDVASAVAVVDYPVPSFAGQRTGIAQLMSRALELVCQVRRRDGRAAQRCLHRDRDDHGSRGLGYECDLLAPW